MKKVKYYKGVISYKYVYDSFLNGQLLDLNDKSIFEKYQLQWFFIFGINKSNNLWKYDLLISRAIIYKNNFALNLLFFYIYQESENELPYIEFSFNNFFFWQGRIFSIFN